MRNSRLMDWEWVAEIQYENHPDSELHIAGTDCPDFLSAAARVVSHVRGCWPYEITSLKQRKYNQPVQPTS